MPLTKSQIIEKLATETGLTKKKATDTIETVLEIIKESLSSRSDVLVSGFGKFSVHNKSERKGRNPATGEEMMLPPRTVVTFKCADNLRKAINNQDD